MTIAHVPRRPALLVILDGVGISHRREHNGVYLANTPNLDGYLREDLPFTVLDASGEAVGLPKGQMGNSEVGHLTLGSGTVSFQDLVRIDRAIEDGSFNHNPRFLDAIAQAKRSNGRVHLLGLVSDGGVHSHIKHLLALIRLCAEHAATPVVHMITDGRDTPPCSALNYLATLESALHAAHGRIGSVMGRFYAMDRDRRWPRTEQAWRALIRGEGTACRNAEQAIQQSYEQGLHDEFITPHLIADVAPIAANDVIISFNFRSDRVRQIVAALTDEQFPLFDRGDFQPRRLVCMTQYSEQFKLPIAYTHQAPPTCLAQVVSHAGIQQFHCAETEKYAHVTYFFNGGREEPYPGETRKMIPSPQVETYDKAPQMSAHSVADAVIEAIESERYGFIVVNFANGDMVGHTANEAAIITAVETLDREVDRVIKAALAHDYSAIVTADHGNCEEMIDANTGEPHTQHTTNPVPCVVFDAVRWQLNNGCGLSSIAPTLLQLMGLEIPVEMTGPSLLEEPGSQHVKIRA